jgi:type I restriction enzyme S subunit
MFGDPVTNPLSWTCRSLDEVTNKVTDGEHLNPAFAESGMPIVMAGNVLVDQIDLGSAKRVEASLGQQFRKKCGPEFGDLLIVGRGATIGRLCRVNLHDSFCLMGSVILVKPDRSMLDERYLSGMLAMPSMHAMLYKTSGSSAQQAIYLKDVKRLACPVPPLSLQHTFATRIQAIEAIKAIQRTALTELDALFASLQHRAFRGEL